MRELAVCGVIRERAPKKVEGEPVWAPLCIWCGAEWSDENIRAYDLDAGDHCASGRFYPESVTVAIICHSCGRKMYEKTGVEC